MTCIKFSTRAGAAIVCVDPVYRLHVSGRYVYMDWHPYTGPLFSYSNGEPYDPVDEDDPVWDAFETWHTKYTKSKQNVSSHKN